MKRAKALLYLGILLLSGCAGFAPNTSDPEVPSSAEEATSSPEAALGPAESSPATSPAEWTVRNLKHLAARVEFSGGDTKDTVVCGVSFFNAIKDPKTVTAVLLVADGELHPLEEFTTTVVKSETHELRIRSVLSRKSLLTALEAETLYLIAVIDRIEYQFEPGRDFAVYKKWVQRQFMALP
jgi:hypothetical protein